MVKAFVAVAVIGIAGIGFTWLGYWFAVIRKKKNWNNYR